MTWITLHSPAALLLIPFLLIKESLRPRLTDPDKEWRTDKDYMRLTVSILTNAVHDMAVREVN